MSTSICEFCGQTAEDGHTFDGYAMNTTRSVEVHSHDTATTRTWGDFLRVNTFVCANCSRLAFEEEKERKAKPVFLALGAFFFALGLVFSVLLFSVGGSWGSQVATWSFVALMEGLLAWGYRVGQKKAGSDPTPEWVASHWRGAIAAPRGRTGFWPMSEYELFIARKGPYENVRSNLDG